MNAQDRIELALKNAGIAAASALLVGKDPRGAMLDAIDAAFLIQAQDKFPELREGPEDGHG